MRQKFGLIFLIIFAIVMTLGAAPPPDTPSAPPSFLRLKYATFDPLQSEPAIPDNLRMPRLAFDTPAAFIVQFEGTIQDEWKTQLLNLGGQIENYLPDNAFLIRSTPAIADVIAQMDGVRWVGVFQPAYKISPNIDSAKGNRYKVQLASWANTEDALAEIAPLVDSSGGTGQTLVIAATTEQLASVAQLSDVMWIESYQIPHILNDVATGIMKVPTAWNLGYTGAGQIVTIADTGLDTGVDLITQTGDIHLDFDNRVTHIHSYPVQNYTGISNVGANDGAADVDSGHGTHVTGSVAGNGARSSNTIRGAAYEADITFQAVEEWTTFNDGTSSGYYLTGIPSDIKTLFAKARSWGSRIHTNSWGSDTAGEYTTDSQNADDFIWYHKDFTILFAAGNAGEDANSNGYVDEGSVGSPATAKNVITIGASDNVRSSGGYQFQWSTGSWASDYPTDPTKTDLISDSAEEMAAFSSRGPTDDGRIKPDLVAPGTNILSTRSISATGTGWGIYNDYYMYNGGTSMATPLAAGAVAVVRDYLMTTEAITPSAALIKAILINSADDISGYGNITEEAGQPIPNMHEGWGRINVASAVSATNRTLYNDDLSRLLSTGDSFTVPFTVTDTTDEFKTTLVWSDYPGLPSAAKELVNNLDLIVTAPNGSTTYYGNHFSNGWSTTGGITDTVNNVENVYIHNPVSGTWTIEVVGANIPHGPQAFALVVDGATAPPAPVLDKFIYLPLVLKNYCAGCPTAGYWQSSNTLHEFYVTTDHANIDSFAIYISACGTTYKITHTSQEPISNNQFSFTGSFYASGTFNSTTSASGTDGLDHFYISGCGSVSGGPWNWTATWQNSSQPRVFNARVVEADNGQVHPQHDGITVTQMP